MPPAVFWFAADNSPSSLFSRSPCKWSTMLPLRRAALERSPARRAGATRLRAPGRSISTERWRSNTRCEKKNGTVSGAVHSSGPCPLRFRSSLLFVLLFFRFGGLALSLFGWFGGGRGARLRVERRGLAVLHDRDRRDLAVLHLEDRHLGVLAVALGIELHVAGRAVEGDVEELRRELGGIGGIGLLHRLDHRVGRVVVVRRVLLDLAELLGERVHEVLARGLARQARLGAHHALGRLARELAHLVGARAVAEREDRLDAELARLLEHRAAGRVHAAVEDDVRTLGLDAREDRAEVGLLVGGVRAADDRDLVALERLLDLVREALAVRGLVVDDRDLLRLELARDVGGDRRALLVVAAHGAEHRLHAALGERRVGRGARDHRDAGLRVDLGGGDRDAGVQVPDHRGDLRVDELLRHRGAGRRVRLVVLAVHHELDGLPADREVLRIRLVDREMHAVLVVLAEMGDGAGEGSRVRDGDGHFGRSRRGARIGGGVLRGLFLLAAAADRDGGCDGDDEGKRAFHRFSPGAVFRALWAEEARIMGTRGEACQFDGEEKAGARAGFSIVIPA